MNNKIDEILKSVEQQKEALTEVALQLVALASHPNGCKAGQSAQKAITFLAKIEQQVRALSQQQAWPFRGQNLFGASFSRYGSSCWEGFGAHFAKSFSLFGAAPERGLPSASYVFFADNASSACRLPVPTV
jgi:hypothetical protein